MQMPEDAVSVIPTRCRLKQNSHGGGQRSDFILQLNWSWALNNLHPIFCFMSLLQFYGWKCLKRAYFRVCLPCRGLWSFQHSAAVNATCSSNLTSIQDPWILALKQIFYLKTIKSIPRLLQHDYKGAGTGVIVYTYSTDPLCIGADRHSRNAVIIVVTPMWHLKLCSIPLGAKIDPH